jgi:tellurite resistance protein TerC
MAWIRGYLPIKEVPPASLGNPFFLREKGKLMVTPLFLILILVESTDLIFALDSIPAIFSITQDAFVIYTSNAFAIMGLRSLYFALADMMDRFRYLKAGISLILLWIGGKMLLEPWTSISPGLSLGVTLAILSLSVLASLFSDRPHNKG